MPEQTSTERSGQLYDRLINPVSTVTGPERLRLSRLAASIYLFAILLLILIFVLRAAFGVIPLLELISRAALVVLFLLAYGLVRAGLYYPSVGLVVVSSAASLFVLAIFGPDGPIIGPLNYLTVTILFSGIFLPPLATLGLLLVQLIALFTIPLIAPSMSITEIVRGPLSLYLTFSLLALALILHRNRLERERQAQLEANERKLRAVLDNSVDAIRLLDEQGRVLEWNPANESFNGLRAEQTMGRHYWNLMRQYADEDSLRAESGLDFDGYQAMMETFLKDGQLPEWFRSEEHLIVPTGVMAHAHNFLIETEQGYMLATIQRDITEQKALEAEISRYQQNLEQLVKQRTEALQKANQQLRVEVQIREEAQEALNTAFEKLSELSAAKDEFVANISHELRTPLTNTKLFLRLLPTRADRFDEYLTTLTREIDRLQYIIESLLYLSELVGDRATLIAERVNLCDLVRSFVGDRMALAAESGLDLILAEMPDNCPVEADPRSLDRVLGIVLDNAFSYTPSGGTIRLTIAACQRDHAAGYLIAVADTGPGIPLKEQSRLFERFFRGRVALERKVAGTGLGLNIARTVIEQQGGGVQVHSSGEAGSGTTVTIWLPADVSAPDISDLPPCEQMIR